MRGTPGEPAGWLPQPHGSPRLPRRRREPLWGPGKQRGPTEHPGERRRELLVPDGHRSHGVHRTDEAFVGEGAGKRIGEVVEVDPGQPLAAVTDSSTETGQEHGPQELEQHSQRRPRARRRSSWSRHGGRLRGRSSRRFPTLDHLGEESLPSPGALVEGLVAPVPAVVPDRGRREEHPHTSGPDHRLSEATGGLDATRGDRPLVCLGEATCDGRTARCTTASTPSKRRGSGSSGRQVRSSSVRDPPYETDHTVARGGEKAQSAVPTRPDDPVTATVSSVGSRRRRSACTARSSRSWVCR